MSTWKVEQSPPTYRDREGRQEKTTVGKQMAVAMDTTVVNYISILILQRTNDISMYVFEGWLELL